MERGRLAIDEPKPTDHQGEWQYYSKTSADWITRMWFVLLLLLFLFVREHLFFDPIELLEGLFVCYFHAYGLN